ncbi:MAG: hypothetical protein CME63_01600 [Halobacteriovoraceae bacterium]|nr:hypothetical protein [Halobacteriovoraceae bacterium]|tara:strand:+ start:44057 stop:44389 length:333 start_codon:yes stop_codon:yes gene_type:complete
MTSFPRKTPVGATTQFIESLETNHGITLRENNGASPVSSGGGRNIYLTVPSGHYAKVSSYAGASVLVQGRYSVSLRGNIDEGSDQKIVSDFLLTEGQVVNGTFFYLLYEV